MPNIVIRHLSGTKANQVEEIPLQGFREVLIGREANAHVRFDADREDLVSRNHARIVRDPADPNGFLLTDLGSRNGTFINRQRIYAASRLQHGDRVQLGPSGPEFAFEMDPPPAARPTRLAESAPAPPTREAPMGSSVSGTAVPPGMVDTRQGPDAPRPVGRAAVERLGEAATQMKGESRKNMWVAVIGILVVLVAAAAYFAWNRQQQMAQAAKLAEEQAQVQSSLNKVNDQLLNAKSRAEEAAAVIRDNQGSKSPEAQKKVADAQAKQQQAEADKLAAEKTAKELQAKLDDIKKQAGAGSTAARTGSVAGSVSSTSGNLAVMSPEQIHAANVRSVILIEATWKITDIGTGGQIYLYHHANTSPEGAQVCQQYPMTDRLPMFTDDSSGKLTPVLSTLPDGGNNTPIVGAISGSGFIVGSEGFFLTNRHVLAPWRATASVADFTPKKMGLKWKNNTIVGCLSAAEFPTDWIPSEGSKMVVEKVVTTTEGTTSSFSGRLEASQLHTSVQGEAVFNVTFAKTTQRYRATSVTVSEKVDVALGKVDTPSGAKAVTMFPDAAAIKPGQPVVVMGYPAISPDVFGAEVSRDMFTSRAHLSAIADPTLTTGPISKVLASGNSIKGVDGYISSGEVYQLGINTTGAGNSGGPVFDTYGRVIAIFYAGRTYGGASVTFAVPVKYGKELIDNSPVMQ
jgi:serine protease Do